MEFQQAGTSQTAAIGQQSPGGRQDREYSMQVQVNTDNHIEGSAELSAQVEQDVTSAFARFEPQLTRVEVHLKDANSHKVGDRDKQCSMEARMSGLKPIAATHEAPALPEAINGAIDKLQRALERTTSKLGHVKGRTSFGGDQTI
jgi:ribosome-associated translation inhibitor RaiA